MPDVLIDLFTEEQRIDVETRSQKLDDLARQILYDE
jgi:hypothetical protein